MASLCFNQTQMAERRREFEELLQTEQLEREEVVRKVVEENQERVVSLQTALNQERQDSLRQVQQLQAETAEIKVSCQSYFRLNSNSLLSLSVHLLFWIHSSTSKCGNGQWIHFTFYFTLFYYLFKWIIVVKSLKTKVGWWHQIDLLMRVVDFSFLTTLFLFKQK